MNEDLLRFQKNQRYVVFDFETCNLNLASLDNKPWQLAFLIAEGNKIVEKHDYYIAWDDLKVSPEAAKITGFSKSKYNKNKTDARQVLDHLDKYLYDEDYINLGHNIFGFDIYIHNILRKNLGLPSDYSYIKRSIDTFSLAKSIEKNIEYRKNEHLSIFQFKLNSYRHRGASLSLSSCCKRYEVDFDPSKLHDALYDITKNFDVFKKMIWDLEI
jgi:DNA polymerase III alpha subunit (gram-positive type)